jgi:hypothetical protein
LTNSPAPPTKVKCSITRVAKPSGSSIPDTNPKPNAKPDFKTY